MLYFHCSLDNDFVRLRQVCTNVSLWIGLAVLGLSALGLGAVEVKKRRGHQENESGGGGGKVAQADAAASQRLAANENEEGL